MCIAKGEAVFRVKVRQSGQITKSLVISIDLHPQATMETTECITDRISIELLHRAANAELNPIDSCPHTPSDTFIVDVETCNNAILKLSYDCMTIVKERGEATKKGGSLGHIVRSSYHYPVWQQAGTCYA